MNTFRFLTVVALAVGAACAAPSRSDEHLGSASEKIVFGTDSDESQDAVVLVMHYDALLAGGDTTGCTGTMLTPKLVLTARHCVAVTDESAACSDQGPLAGGVVYQDRPASKLYAFSGKTRPDFLSGKATYAKGAALIDDGANTLCNHDIALIVLEKPLEGTKIAPVRLESGPKKDEVVTLVGWGITDKSPTPNTRQQRTGVTVTELGKAEFRVTEGACSGDSGGPALSSQGAVLGVLSRGGVAGGEAGAAGCVGSGNEYTSLVAFKDLVLSAYDKAGQPAWLEGEPDPTAAPPAAEDARASGCTVGRAPCAGSRWAAAVLVALGMVRRRGSKRIA